MKLQEKVLGRRSHRSLFVLDFPQRIRLLKSSVTPFSHLNGSTLDAEARSEYGGSIKLWLIQIKEVAELIEYVLNEQVLKVSQRIRQRGFISFLGKAGRLIVMLNSRRNIASNMQNIKALLNDIKERDHREKGYYGRSITIEWHQSHFVSPLLEECSAGFNSAGIIALKLLIAEGFVQGQTGQTLEEIAETYLNELIHRNIVQAFQGFYELEKFYRVHELMYEIARQKADEFRICQVWDDNLSCGRKGRRISIYNNVECVGNHRRLPDELGNLFHLKHLSLKNTKLRRLPKSLAKLLNLQSLDLRNTMLTELPTEINMLQNLRHLLASGYDKYISWASTREVRIKEGIGCLENLQTLVTVEAHLIGIGLIRDLEILGKLRKLGISRLTAEGQLQQLQDWFLSLQNLRMLFLSFSRLSIDPLYCLCPLPNLASLWLYRAYEGEQLHFEEGGFPQLKLLVLRELHGLKVVEIEEGALPYLEELRIGSSPLLKEVPSGVQHLSHLKVLANYDMPSECVQNATRWRL
ncbi:LRR domain containing protein [Parasponia andersonii]|uniref:LRR domain containing protein n=1 Tax=Parasponia andersonii TaxID=3476 RepID=A0A2P5C434_PARAD|nr:LRR domain containing protein [Parasponia andersonii]